MSDFIRARSSEQKEQRMAEIKAAADALFADRPYHEISLTTIAERMQWTRANLYKYVTSKEEIFLELCADRMNGYFDALQAAFPVGCGYPLEVYAEVWTGILCAHTDYLRYHALLSSIIETNVTVDRLAAFKANYYRRAEELTAMLRQNLGLSQEDAYDLTLSVLYHAVGLQGICRWNPLVEQALSKAGIRPRELDFRRDMRRFIGMNLKFFCSEP